MWKFMKKVYLQKYIAKFNPAIYLKYLTFWIQLLFRRKKEAEKKLSSSAVAKQEGVNRKNFSH